MADTYEKDLSAKSSLTTSDYIRVVGSDNVSYKQGMSSVKGALGLGWNVPSSSVTSLAELQAYIDGLYSSEATGVRFGYIPSAIANNCGLSGSHYFQTFSNSANYRIIVVYSVNGDRLRMCGKSNGTWATAWKYISLN